MKDLQTRFAEVEKRVKALISENADLRKRIAGLERELEQVREESREFQGLQGKKAHIRERIERILGSLESLAKKEA